MILTPALRAEIARYTTGVRRARREYAIHPFAQSNCRGICPCGRTNR